MDGHDITMVFSAVLLANLVTFLGFVLLVNFNIDQKKEAILEMQRDGKTFNEFVQHELSAVHKELTEMRQAKEKNND